MIPPVALCHPPNIISLRGRQLNTPPHDPVHTSSNSPLSSARDAQISTAFPAALPLVEGETTVTSSDGGFEEILQLPILQENFPIDPAIIADDEAWETDDLRGLVRQGDGLVGLKPICLYPGPPLSMFWDAPDSRQIPEERLAGNTLAEGNPHIHGSQPQNPSRLSAETDAPCFSSVDEGSRPERAKSLKRGAEGLEEQTAKRPRVASPAGEGSFTALRCHFLSLCLDERLQFLSWLFEGALANCTPDSDESARLNVREDPREETEQTRPERGEGRKGGDKRWRWSAEEDARLWDMVEERRSWSEIERCFPGRTESALRQRQSRLQKNQRRIRPAKPTATTPAVAVVPPATISAPDTDVDSDRSVGRWADFRPTAAIPRRYLCGCFCHGSEALEILHGSAVTPPAAVDQWTAVDNPQLSPDDETRGLVRKKKKARWTRKDDERLGSLRARDWRWWEIKQQFSHRTVAALQQRCMKLRATRLTNTPKVAEDVPLPSDTVASDRRLSGDFLRLRNLH
ncbi:hypothetical protein LOZ65_006524 [Ophidiomyces ophidiicola]|nr:hypothetical protein LOZ65_006524 [Ophidiomyces ophidiicola]